MEIKEYNGIIDGRNFFSHPIKIDWKTSKNFRKIGNGQCDDYTTGCLLHYSYFKKYYKFIVIDVNIQQELNGASKAMQQIKFTGNFIRGGGAIMYILIEKAKKTILDFSKGTVKVLWFYFV